MRHDVWATVEDPGEAEGMFPVVRYLRAFGVSVQLLASGHALKELRSKGCEHWDATDTKSMYDQHEAPKLLLATTASSGGAGRDLVPLLRGKSKTVLLQSLWGGLAGWDDRHQPDYVITNDRISERLVTTLWPTLNPESVLKTGFPMLDKYAGLM